MSKVTLTRVPNMGDILNQTVEEALAEMKIPQVSTLPRGVETMATRIDNNFRMTADALDASADALEKRAADLRAKADYLRNERSLAERLRSAVQYERDCWDEARGLAQVAMPDRTED